MRSNSIVPAFLAAFLVTSVAFAASTKVVANFIAQESSGVSGQATLNALPQGGTVIHGKITGLQPSTDYLSQYFTDGTCTAAPGTEVTRFRSNPQGMAEFNAKVDKNLGDIKSISIQLGSDMSLKACAAVTQ
jgi:hypothetical protein